MAIYYPSGCDESLPYPTCSECGDIENGRVRSVAFKKTTYTFADPTDTVEWQAALASGDVMILPFTRGSFDGGTPKKVAGYGNVKERLVNFTYKLIYFDPAFPGNKAFYDVLKNSSNWEVIFLTSSKMQFSNAPVSVIPKAPIEDDLESEVVFNVEVEWVNADLPVWSEIPADIFDDCFAVS